MKIIVVRKSVGEHSPCRFKSGLGDHIVPWCNGNTGDFESLIPGSSPGGTTNFCLGNLVAKVPALHADYRGFESHPKHHFSQ